MTGMWTRADVLLAAGTATALAASADAAWTVYRRFAVDFSGLSAPERAAAALWDARPLATAVFVLGAVCVWIALGEPRGALDAVHAAVRPVVALLAGAHVAFGVLVLAATVWVAAAGRLGQPDELGFGYTAGERATTLATQLAAWLPLAGVLVVLASLMARGGDDVADAGAAEEARPLVGDEMQGLWERELAHGPRRERARALLERIRALEAAGDHEGALRLSEEMRRL